VQGGGEPREPRKCYGCNSTEHLLKECDQLTQEQITAKLLERWGPRDTRQTRFSRDAHPTRPSRDGSRRNGRERERDNDARGRGRRRGGDGGNGRVTAGLPLRWAKQLEQRANLDRKPHNGKSSKADMLNEQKLTLNQAMAALEAAAKMGAALGDQGGVPRQTLAALAHSCKSRGAP
jgi:hypothetical protein